MASGVTEGVVAIESPRKGRDEGEAARDEETEVARDEETEVAGDEETGAAGE